MRAISFAVAASAAMLAHPRIHAQTTETVPPQSMPGTAPAPTDKPSQPVQTTPAPTAQPPDAPIPARPAYLPAPTKKQKVQDTPANYAPAQTSPTNPPAVAAEPTPQRPVVARNPYDGTPIVTTDRLGSAYIPVDSWMYPALLRLYSMGYLNTAYISMRPWTRRSTLHMLEQTESDVRSGGNVEAIELLNKLEDALESEPDSGGTQRRGLLYGVESVYTGVRQVSGPTLRDSWHVGQTFVNDYGRPYSTGFNTYDGFSALAEKGPFSLYVRAEYQHAPSYTGYTFAQANALSIIDQIPYSGYNRPQDTLPEGTLPSQNNFRILEANLSAHVYGHEISLGKSDAWLGPGLGGAMAWSNNAENMYNFRINRVEPLHIPYVSRVVGDLRYDFFIGSLKGHTYPNSPWAHSEILATKLFNTFDLTFQRTIIFGGKDHEPVTLHTFLKGFFDINDTTVEEKYSRNDPGARFSSVTFAWRLPYTARLLTLYTDSTTHDDVFPLSAPRRAGWRPGIYLSRVPFVPKLDLRVEGTYTDFVTSTSFGGQGNYYETIQRQGYTNKGFIMGDWIGREGKGGNATVTYHLSGNESISLGYLRKKNAKDFIQYGTTQDDFRVDLTKRLKPNVELTAWYQHEIWRAPLITTPNVVGPVNRDTRTNDTGSFQVKWYPRLHSTNE